MKKKIYEKILELYNKNIDEGRIFMYENMGLLMRKNPLLRHKNYTFTTEDILSESFLIADNIMLRKDITDNKKLGKLWYLFNRGGGALYNKLNQFGAEVYTIEDIRENDKRVYNMDVDVLEYVLVKNNIISPLEAKIIKHLGEGRGKYEIARLMKTTYYNIRDIIDAISIKIKKFITDNEIEDDNNS